MGYGDLWRGAPRGCSGAGRGAFYTGMGSAALRETLAKLERHRRSRVLSVEIHLLRHTVSASFADPGALLPLPSPSTASPSSTWPPARKGVATRGCRTDGGCRAAAHIPSWQQLAWASPASWLLLLGSFGGLEGTGMARAEAGRTAECRELA